MKIRCYSDLHWEFDNRKFLNDSVWQEGKSYMDFFWTPPVMDGDKNSVLILAGDLFYGIKSLDIIEAFAYRFKSVIIVMGNHDYWHNDFKTLVQQYRTRINTSELLRNVYLLDNSTLKIDDVTFIGGTLWTDMDRGNPLVMMNAKKVMEPDFKYIENFEQMDWVNAHKQLKDFIHEETRNNLDEKFVVVTHHLPSFGSVHENYRNRSAYPLNYFFYSDLDYMIEDAENISVWFHGHTHNSFDYEIGKTRIVCNPRGYNDENKTFNHQIIEV